MALFTKETTIFSIPLLIGSLCLLEKVDKNNYKILVKKITIMLCIWASNIYLFYFLRTISFTNPMKFTLKGMGAYFFNNLIVLEGTEKGVINLEAGTPEQNEIILEGDDPDVLALLQQEDGSKIFR